MFSKLKYFAFLLFLSVSIAGSPTSLDEEDDQYVESESDYFSNDTEIPTLGWDVSSNAPIDENLEYAIKRVNLSAFDWPSSSPAPPAVDYGIDQTIRTVFKDKPDMWNYVAGLMSNLIFPTTTTSRPERSRYYPLPPEEVYSTVKHDEMGTSLRPEIEETTTPIVHTLNDALLDPVLDVRDHSANVVPTSTQFRNFNSSLSPNRTAFDRAATLLEILRSLNLTYHHSMDDRSFEPGSWKKLFDDSGNIFWNASWMNHTVNAPKNSTAAASQDSHVFSNETAGETWSRISILDLSAELTNTLPVDSAEMEGLTELIENLTESLKDAKFDLNSSRFEVLNFTIPPEAESWLNYSTSVRFPRDRNESRSGNETIDVRSGDKLLGSTNSSEDGRVKFFEEEYDLQNIAFWFVKSGYKVNQSTSKMEYETPGNWSVKGRSFQPTNFSDPMNITVRSHPPSAFTAQFAEILHNMAAKVANETKKIHQEIEVFLKDNKDHIVVHTFNDNYAYNLTDRNSSNAKTNYDALTELELRVENEIQDVINSTIGEALDVKLSRSGKDSLLNAFHQWLTGDFSKMCRVNYTNEECETLLRSIRADLHPLDSSPVPTSQPHFATTTTTAYGTSSTYNYLLTNFTEPKKPNARFFNPQHLHGRAMDEMEAVHTSPEFHQTPQKEMHEIESPLKNDSNYLRQLAESYEGRNNTKDRYYLKGSHQSKSTNLTLEVHHLLKDLDHSNNESNSRMARNGRFTFIGNESVSAHELMEEPNFNVSTEPPQFRTAMNDSRLINISMELMGRSEAGANLNATSEPAEFRTVMNDSGLVNVSMEIMGRSEDGSNLNATSEPAEFRTVMNESGLANISMEIMGRSEDGSNLNATSEPAEFRTVMNESGPANVSMEIMGRSEDGSNLNATSEPAEFRTVMNDSGLVNVSMEIMGRSENGSNLNATSEPARLRTAVNDSGLFNVTMELMRRNEKDSNHTGSSEPAELRTSENDDGLVNISMELKARNGEDGSNLNATSEPAEFRTAMNDSELLNISTNMGRNVEDKLNLTILEPVEFRNSINGNSSFNVSLGRQALNNSYINASFDYSELSRAVNETGYNLSISSDMGRDGGNDSDSNVLMERSLQNKPTLINSTKPDQTLANKTNFNDSKNVTNLERTGRNETVAKFNESIGTLEFRSAAENFTQLEAGNSTNLDGRKPIVDFLVDKIKGIVNGTQLLKSTRRRKRSTTPSFSSTSEDQPSNETESTSPQEVSTTTAYKTETTNEYYLENGNIMNQNYNSSDSSGNYGPTEPAYNSHRNTNFLPIFGTNNEKMSLDNYLHQSEAGKHSDLEHREPFPFPSTKICYRNEDCATELYEICIHTLFTNYCDCPHTMSRNKITKVCRTPFFNNYPYYPVGYQPRYKSGSDVSVVQTR